MPLGGAMQLDIYNILQKLPHRYPFLLIDKVVDIKLDEQTITGQKNVTFNEPFFNGHFPENPVMPGVLIAEAMAQATAILAYTKIENDGQNSDQNKTFFLAGVDNFRVKQSIVPGDIMYVYANIGKGKKGIYKSSASVKVGDNIACSAELTAAYREI